jgi:uncharacterized LabA/DUF88 family protein
MSRRKPLYVFVDASNIWEAQKAKGRFIDWKKLVNYLLKQHSPSTALVYFYTSFPAKGTRDYSTDGKHKFYTYLKKGLGFIVRKKPLKRITHIDALGESVKEKGNMDVELTIDAIHNKDKYDEAVLFTGDSDFLELVNYLRRRKKKIYIYSSKNNISQELRTGSDGYKDVLGIEKDIWGKELQHRN